MDVIIIGGGVAGLLYLGAILSKEGKKVLVLEQPARSRRGASLNS